MKYRFSGFVTAWALVAIAGPAAYSDTKPVAQGGTLLTAGNDFLQVHIQSAPGSAVGEFTVTGSGGANVLFGNGHPGTSYTTIHSYTTNTDYVQGAGKSGFSIDSFGSVARIGSTGFRTTYVLPGSGVTADALVVAQDVVVVGDTASDSAVNVTTTVVNSGGHQQQVGVRYLWDYDIDGDDGPVLTLAGGRPASAAGCYPVSGLTVTGTDGATVTTGLAGDAQAPDGVCFASWEDASSTAFGYVPSATASGSDTAILTYFGSSVADAAPLAPGEAEQVGASLAYTPGATPVVPAADTDKWTITYSPHTVAIGQTVTFTATETGKPDGDKVTWKATNGDPDSGTGTTFKTKYSAAGDQTVKVGGLGDDNVATSYKVKVIKVTATVAAPTRVPMYNSTTPNLKDVTVTLTPSPLPDGVTPVHVVISTTKGTGELALDDDKDARDIKETTTLKVKGVANSSVKKNIKIAAKENDIELGEAVTTVSTWPINFKNTLKDTKLGFGLSVTLQWDSESGDLADLGNTVVREYVSYAKAAPNPPFTVGFVNPTILPDPPADGRHPEDLTDKHSYDPTDVDWSKKIGGTVQSDQQYQFMDTVLDTKWTDGVLGRYTIVRTVAADPKKGGTYIFTTTKTGPGLGKDATSVETP